MIENYQTHILKPDEIVDYSSELMRSFRPEQICYEPMIGFKVLCRDLNSYIMGTNQARFQAIEQTLGVLRNTGCVIRETHMNESSDGFWIVTFPVPKSHLLQQVNNLMSVLKFFADNLGIVSTDVCEINVSGRCNYNETEGRLSSIVIPNVYSYALVEPQNTPYKMGHVIRINQAYILLRTMWDFGRNGSGTKVANRYNELTIIPQILTNAFH